jgi:peroxiredoxin
MHKTLLIGFVVAFVALHAYLKQRAPVIKAQTSVAPLLDGLRDPGAAEITRIAQAHRVTVVTFFETWCGPCKQELPQLAKLYAEREGDGLGMVGIYSASSSDIAGFREQFQLTFPLILDGEGALSGAYGVDAVPTSVVLDANLQVLSAARGFKPSLVADLTALLDLGRAP